jgi:hypothetical protein
MQWCRKHADLERSSGRTAAHGSSTLEHITSEGASLLMGALALCGHALSTIAVRAFSHSMPPSVFLLHGMPPARRASAVQRCSLASLVHLRCLALWSAK